MSNHIRPITAFKKANPELYAEVLDLVGPEASSQKAKENSWYWWYSAVMVYDMSQGAKDSFLFTSSGYCTNKGTVSEVGRLMLTAWYYNIEEWAKNISLYVYNSYHKKRQRADAFNDLEFKAAVKYIRDNIGYYYNNEQELKLYILQTFFEEEVEPLLPEPVDKLKTFKEVKALLNTIHKNRLKSDKNWYIRNYEILEDYCYYLSEILDSSNIPYLPLEDFKAKQERENEQYLKEIQEAESAYRDSLKRVSLPLISSIKPNNCKM